MPSAPPPSPAAVHELDATGLLCPLPVLKAKKALRAVPPGGTLRVRASDPAAPRDFQAFCDTTKCTLLDCREEEGGVFVITLLKPA